MHPATVARILSDVRDAITAAAADADVTLPERTYVVTGGAVYDCEQLSVSGNVLTPGLPGSDVGAIVNCPPSTWYLSLDAALIRSSCAVVQQGHRGNVLPGPDQFATDTEMISGDAAVLSSAAGRVISSHPRYGSGTASILMGEAQGGLLATVLSMTLPAISLEDDGED